MGTHSYYVCLQMVHRLQNRPVHQNDEQEGYNQAHTMEKTLTAYGMARSFCSGDYVCTQTNTSELRVS